MVDWGDLNRRWLFYFSPCFPNVSRLYVYFDGRLPSKILCIARWCLSFLFVRFPVTTGTDFTNYDDCIVVFSYHGNGTVMHNTNLAHIYVFFSSVFLAPACRVATWVHAQNTSRENLQVPSRVKVFSSSHTQTFAATGGWQLVEATAVLALVSFFPGSSLPNKSPLSSNLRYL